MPEDIALAPASEFSSATIAQRSRRSASILLFVLGLLFWIPALLRAKVGAPSSAAAIADSPADDRSSCDDERSAQTAGVSSVIPCAAQTAPGGATDALTNRLTLTTTILGKTHRAAIVNGRLYREGDKIATGGDLYRLARVAEDRIEIVSLGRSVGAKHSVMLQQVPSADHDPQASR